MIKYIKSVLWRIAKHLSYIEDARCLKVNVIGERAKFVLRSITHHVIYAYGEVEVKHYTFIISAPDGGKVSTRSRLEPSEKRRNSGLCHFLDRTAFEM